MRRLAPALVLLAGCASSPEYLPGPPVTVREPTFNGTVTPTPRTSSAADSTPAMPYCPIEPVPEPAPRSLWSSVSDRFGYRWGEAVRLPYRDRGLDRLMNNTLSSTGPGGYTTSRGLIELEIETWPYENAALAPVNGNNWLFPAPERSSVSP